MNSLPPRSRTLAPGWQLLVLLGLIIVGLSVGTMLGVGLAAAIYNLSLAQVQAMAAGQPHAWAVLMLLQGAGMAGAGAAVLALPRLAGRTVRNYFAPHSLRGPGWPLAAVLLVLLVLPAISIVVAWNAHAHFPTWAQGFERWARAAEDQAQVLTAFLTTFSTPARLLVGILVVALTPAVAEELVFRGVLQPNLVRALGSRHLGIWLTAAIFSAIHVQFFGFVPRLLLGLVLGYLYDWSGNILVSMAAHFTQNAFQLLLLYLFQRSQLPVVLNPDANQTLPWPLVLLSGLLSAALLVALHRQRVPPKSTATYP